MGALWIPCKMKGSDVGFFWGGEKQQVSQNPLMSNTGGRGAQIQQTDTQTGETNTQIHPDSQ